MTTPIVERLAAIRHFLTADILPNVPGALRGELRAAIKLLADMDDEIDHLPRLLDGETRAMLAGCDAGFAALAPSAGDEAESIAALHQRLDPPSPTTRESTAIHDEAAQLMGRIAVRLAARVRDSAPGHEPSSAQAALAQCHQLLAAQAAARASWQSVFGAEGLYATGLTSPQIPEQRA